MPIQPTQPEHDNQRMESICRSGGVKLASGAIGNKATRGAGKDRRDLDKRVNRVASKGVAIKE